MGQSRGPPAAASTRPDVETQGPGKAVLGFIAAPLLCIPAFPKASLQPEAGKPPLCARAPLLTCPHGCWPGDKAGTDGGALPIHPSPPAPPLLSPTAPQGRSPRLIPQQRGMLGEGAALIPVAPLLILPNGSLSPPQWGYPSGRGSPGPGSHSWWPPASKLSSNPAPLLLGMDSSGADPSPSAPTRARSQIYLCPCPAPGCKVIPAPPSPL